MHSSMIHVESVNKYYKQHHVLKNISFTINQGEIIALLGQNGAGKSTLINIMIDLIRPNSGHISLFDNRFTMQEIRHMTGIMLQSNITLERLTVREVIQLMQSYYQEPASYATLLDLAQLKEEEHMLTRKLSGGQKRRLSFAVALAGNPDLIFLDEPTAGMDSPSRARLWEKIGELKQLGKTIIVTSHYLEELEDIATRLLILQKGSLTFDGTLETLRRTQGQGTIAFDCQSLPFSIQHLSNVLNYHQQGNHYTIITQDVNTILKQLYPHLDSLANITVQQTTLETLFNYYHKEEQSS